MHLFCTLVLSAPSRRCILASGALRCRRSSCDLCLRLPSNFVRSLPSPPPERDSPALGAAAPLRLEEAHCGWGEAANVATGPPTRSRHSLGAARLARGSGPLRDLRYACDFRRGAAWGAWPPAGAWNRVSGQPIFWMCRRGWPIHPCEVLYRVCKGEWRHPRDVQLQQRRKSWDSWDGLEPRKVRLL